MKQIAERITAIVLVLCLLAGCAAFAEEEEFSLEEIVETVELTDEEEEDLSAFDVPADAQNALDSLDSLDFANEVDTTTDPDSLDLNTNLPDHVINILLIGIDTREAATTSDSENAARGDVQMILSINTQTGELKMTSIQRDTYVDIPGYKKGNRINTAYQFGGGQLAMRTINKNFEMNIQNYVSINFYGLASIIDAIGGIDINLTKREAGAINAYLKKHPPKYDNTDGKSRKALKREAGTQHLDGVQAVMYARLREIDNDFARTARQRHLMELLLEKVMQDMDVSVLLKLLETVLPYVYTNVDVQTIFALAQSVLQSGIVNRARSGETLMEDFRIPMDHTYYYPSSGTQYTMMNSANLKKNIQALHTFIYGEYYPAN